MWTVVWLIIIYISEVHRLLLRVGHVSAISVPFTEIVSVNS